MIGQRNGIDAAVVTDHVGRVHSIGRGESFVQVQLSRQGPAPILPQSVRIEAFDHISWPVADAQSIHAENGGVESLYVAWRRTF